MIEPRKGLALRFHSAGVEKHALGADQARSSKSSRSCLRPLARLLAIRSFFEMTKTFCRPYVDSTRLPQASRKSTPSMAVIRSIRSGGYPN
jgi:hypothetical protein